MLPISHDAVVCYSIYLDCNQAVVATRTTPHLHSCCPIPNSHSPLRLCLHLHEITTSYPSLMGLNLHPTLLSTCSWF